MSIDVSGRAADAAENAVDWLDERTGFARFARGAMRKVFPDHWSFLLGEVALFNFIILVVTGTFLTFFFQPDTTPVIYQGDFAPLQGQPVSAAFNSVLNLSFEVKAGLLMRQVHHWAALIFVGSIAVHMMRVFFTGAFRKPRELNWLIGIGLVILALADGFSGYSLPDDLLSGTGMRITYGAVMSIPFVGPYIAFLVFGGEFPTSLVISRLFVLHVLFLPLLYIGAITVHIGLVFIQKHTAYRSSGATETTVVGPRFWPVQVFRSTGLFFLVAAVIALIAGLFEINPVWDYGPFLPQVATVPAQPDWYLGWLEGALRLGLPFEPTLLGITLPSAFIPALVIPGIAFGIIALWPWIERRITGDRRSHNLLDSPSDSPLRTATGVAILTFFLVLTVAGGNDVLGTMFRVNITDLTSTLRVGLVLLPVAMWLITYRVCVQRRARRAKGLAGAIPAEGVAIERNARGGFDEEAE
jgi:ubiquinol-cytochrome c reductase cytochrome b subunit